MTSPRTEFDALTEDLALSRMGGTPALELLQKILSKLDQLVETRSKRLTAVRVVKCFRCRSDIVVLDYINKQGAKVKLILSECEEGEGLFEIVEGEAVWTGCGDYAFHECPNYVS